MKPFSRKRAFDFEKRGIYSSTGITHKHRMAEIMPTPMSVPNPSGILCFQMPGLRPSLRALWISQDRKARKVEITRRNGDPGFSGFTMHYLVMDEEGKVALKKSTASHSSQTKVFLSNHQRQRQQFTHPKPISCTHLTRRKCNAQ